MTAPAPTTSVIALFPFAIFEQGSDGPYGHARCHRRPTKPAKHLPDSGGVPVQRRPKAAQINIMEPEARRHTHGSWRAGNPRPLLAPIYGTSSASDVTPADPPSSSGRQGQGERVMGGCRLLRCFELLEAMARPWRRHYLTASPVTARPLLLRIFE